MQREHWYCEPCAHAARSARVFSVLAVLVLSCPLLFGLAFRLWVRAAPAASSGTGTPSRRFFFANGIVPGAAEVQPQTEARSKVRKTLQHAGSVLVAQFNPFRNGDATARLVILISGCCCLVFSLIAALVMMGCHDAMVSGPKDSASPVASPTAPTNGVHWRKGQRKVQIPGAGGVLFIIAGLFAALIGVEQWREVLPGGENGFASEEEDTIDGGSETLTVSKASSGKSSGKRSLKKGDKKQQTAAAAPPDSNGLGGGGGDDDAWDQSWDAEDETRRWEYERGQYAQHSARDSRNAGNLNMQAIEANHRANRTSAVVGQ